MSLLDGMQIEGRALTVVLGNALNQSPVIDLSIEVAGQVEISLGDPERLLFAEGGLLDQNSDGLLDRDLELTMPVNGRQVAYRLAKVTRSGSVTTMPCEDRTSHLLRRHRGYRKMARKRTEGAQAGATFGQWATVLLDEVKSPRIRRIIPELDRLGRVAAVDLSSLPEGDAASSSRPASDVTATGFDHGAKLTVKKAPVTAAQLGRMTTVQQVADAVNASPLERLAMTLAPIGESNYGDEKTVNPSSGASGTFQMLASTARSLGISTSDTKKQAEQFYSGGFRGPNTGVKEYHARQPGAGAGELVSLVEGSDKGGSFYADDLEEARAIVEAWGGGSGSAGGDLSHLTAEASNYVLEDYQFTRGEPGKPESTWNCLGRQADDRGWRRFAVLNDFVLASEERLYKSRSVATLDVSQAGVRSIDFEWAPRKLVSTITAVVNLAHGDLIPGHVVNVVDQGPASGRYLTTQVTQAADSAMATVVARKPIARKAEPAGEVSTDDATTSVSMSGLSLPQRGSVVDRAYAEAARIDARNLPYGQSGHTASWGSSSAADSQDCSSYTSLIVHAAGLMDTVPGPQVSDWFLSWGAPGEGDKMTVWVKPGSGPNGHVMVEFKGYPKDRADTSPYGSGPSGPHLRSTPRSYAGMTPRRWPGV